MNNKRKKIITLSITILILFLIIAHPTKQEQPDILDNPSNVSAAKDNITQLEDTIFKDYKSLEVDGGDLSGSRQSNVVVDIGFGNRKYYAFTNEYGQLVKVIAKEIILQDDNKEPVTSKGRYYPDEAKVPGTESKNLDEGHIIADSLGGVSNAYNITPQNSTLNRHGDQAYMEKSIRDAGGCTDFVAIITYPDTKTQIPSHYSYTYTLNGSVINDEFDNINPDKANKKLEENEKTQKPKPTILNNQETTESTSTQEISILEIDKEDEYVIIKNSRDRDIDLTSWELISVLGNQRFTFPKYTLKANKTVKVGGYKSKKSCDFIWEKGRGIWNNSKNDPGQLYDSKSNLIDEVPFN